jgi:radical SAM superfamily enzyme YgiQ (UPF0313 family)
MMPGGCMKILLISPCKNVRFKTPKLQMMPQLALHILEGLTPEEHEVHIIEEETENVDLNEECDLVGLSCMTANAPRAYYFAAEFRKRGKSVVLGGVHPTILPEEAAQHADSVVIGEVENIWEELLEDFQVFKLKKFYRKEPASLERYIPMKNTKEKRGPFNVIPIMTTRGCPYNCEFCSVTNIYGRQIRHVPIENVVRQIEESGGKKYMFLDDNIIGHPKYAKELFKAIRPLNIKWVGQATVSLAKEVELMALAAESGCSGLFFGVESVSETQLKRMKKSAGEVIKIEAAVRRVMDFGIYFHASLIFGFDDDTQAVFPETLEFLNRTKVATASFNILTPYPGTRVYEQFKKEGRLLTEDWKYYDHSTCVFRPKHMSAYELHKGKIWVKKEFSKITNIMKRLPDNLSHPVLFLALNWSKNRMLKKDYKKLEWQSQQIYIPANSMAPEGTVLQR